MKKIGLIFLFVGCSHIPFFSDDEKTASDASKSEPAVVKAPEKAEGASNGENSKPPQVDATPEKGLLGSLAGGFGGGTEDSTKEQRSLQQARILARVNDLENTLNLQTQKIRVLEKAITLGIIPEELKKGQANSHSLDADYGGDSFLADLSPGESSKQSTSSQGSAAKKAAFKKEISEAVAVFGKGEFGKAFILFQKVDQSYGEEDKQGETLFWMGRSWYALKEYQTARQYFQDMIRASPTSSKVSQAKLYMAQGDLKLGMRESAIEGLRDIIRDHQDSPSSQEARKLLADLKDTL
ncbi:MAG: tetratricopeptide repeat protein [Pseudomonadota bacterium]